MHFLLVGGTIFTSLLQHGQTSPTIQINNSYIEGKEVNFLGRKVNQYLGIPYAQPPLGPLRFKKPIPVQSYTKVFQAITNPPACPQYTTQPYPFYINSTEKSEDCLYLNVWTPADASPTNKKAVFYWMHGGIFRYGSMRDELYSGIPLSALGDIIVVTVNYRVGPFGFLTTGTEDAPGNAGIWDLLEGLRWVNRYIENFGGDLTRITLAGESAGAITSGLLTISPLAEGLYTRLILESGSPGTRFIGDNTANLFVSQKLATIAGCANDTYSIAAYPKEVVQCLRGVDASTLSNADYKLSPHLPITFFPFWGDELIPKNPSLAVSKGDFRCKDMLIGMNKDEGSIVVTTSDPDLYGFFGEKNPLLNKSTGDMTIQNFISILPDYQSIVDYYLPSSFPEAASNRIRHEAYTATGDAIMCPSVYYAEKCAEQNKNVYFYFFTHRPSVTPWAPWMGVAHFEEVQFVFGQPVLNPEKYNAPEVVLSMEMINIWSDFVKNGRPSTPWPLYTRENPSFKYLGPKYVTEKNGIGPHLKNCEFLRPYV